jgi:hypothetical protein
MFDKRHETSIFSFESRPRSTFLQSDSETYSPYAGAWKEFDRLQESVRGGGKLAVVRRVFAFLITLSGLGIIEIRHSKGAMYFVLLAFGVILLFEIVYRFTMRNRFLHWPCPRCRSEWPGDKNEKDRACKVYGLRLHQFSA